MLTTLLGLFMRRSFVMPHVFRGVGRISQGVALWQRRRRARKRKQKRARELRLEHHDIDNRQTAGPMFGRLSFLPPLSSRKNSVALGYGNLVVEAPYPAATAARTNRQVSSSQTE